MAEITGTDPLFEKLMTLAEGEDDITEEFVDLCWDSLWLSEEELDALMKKPDCRSRVERDLPLLVFHWMVLPEGGGLYETALTDFRERFDEREIREIECRLAGTAGFFQLRELFPGANQVEVEDIVTSATHRLCDENLSRTGVVGEISAGIIVRHPDGSQSAFNPYSLIPISSEAKDRVAEMARGEFEAENEALLEEGEEAYASFSDFLKGNLEIVAHIAQWELYRRHG